MKTQKCEEDFAKKGGEEYKLIDNTQMCSATKRISTKFFLKEGGTSSQESCWHLFCLLSAADQVSVHRNCTGLEKVQNLIDATRQLCDSHPEKQLGAVMVGVCLCCQSLRHHHIKRPRKAPPLRVHMRSPLRGNGTSSALRQTRAACPEPEVEGPG